jgi:HEAT repeat protein
MKTFWIPLAACATLLLTSSPARADRVGNLVRKLKSGSSAKVKVVAIILIRKYADPRVARALISTLQNDSEDATVRSTAARALGSMRSKQAISALKKAAKSSNSRLKKAARKALETMCPSRVSGKRFYLNMDKIRGKGSLRSLSVALARRHLHRVLARRSDVVTGWRKCRKPSGRALRKKRMKGFYLDTTVKVTNAGGRVKCKVSVLFTTFPSQSIKGNVGASAAVGGSANAGVVAQLIEALVGSLKSDINRFLNSQ